MIEVLPETQGDMLAVRVSGELTNEDFDLYRELIRDRMRKYGAARLYYEMIHLDLNRVKPGAALENAFFDLVHGREYGRVAMVGEKVWQEWAAKLISPVKKKGVRYFDLHEREQAMQWVQEGKV
ncbi:STAS/SEC14 domain-containing protein [Pontibacter anaerobius]|uniref:STAS/SEC14 domain-containing protein n=1 Tax=Pontibacter anaerobius TaxID=2993940 RepID=A0ABT3RD44_9BACT|nr:STAS/SEC14 domain-containing protein [Pontibacter anaerobius]MCX2739467.1 STAS/SEC14 domain-containing protein [Pontibacter anaerobius]